MEHDQGIGDTGRISDQSMAKCEGHDGGPVLTDGLVENVREVMGNRFLAQPQLISDFGVRQPPGYQPQYLYLALCQPGRVDC